MLYLVGTPIGNMGDISERACEVLSEVDLVACEDTRRTGLLLSNLGIKNDLFSYHEHNKAAKGPILVNKLKEGQNIALVSDAGMPCISDPGADLVKLCIEEDLDVTVVPGPVAGITALVMSGLSARRYHFEGFIPVESKERKERISKLKDLRETIIIYEAPHRLLKTIEDLVNAGFGDCRAAFCRELTKKYEQVIRLKLSEASEWFTNTPPKGEFVVCIEPLEEQASEEQMTQEELDALIVEMAQNGEPTKKIAATLAEKTGKNKKELYAYIVNLIK